MQQPTLFDVLERPESVKVPFPHDKKSLMRFFGFDPDGPPTKEVRRTWYSTRCAEEVEVSPEEKFDEFWRDYIHNPVRGQTVKLFVGECLKLGLGLRKGSVDARREMAIQQFPELYSPPEKT